MEQELKILTDFIKEKGLKQTSQREIILRVFLEAPNHLSVDEITRRVQDVDRKIGASTVYRTMKIIVECGLASESPVLSGKACFEKAFQRELHDHLICKGCGGIQEFSNSLIQAALEKVSREFGFEMRDRKVEVYGFCQKCHPDEGEEDRSF